MKLLILDDWLMAKLTADQRRDLMEVIDDRHQRGSTVLATQIPLDCWHEQIGDSTLSWCLSLLSGCTSGAGLQLSSLLFRQENLPWHPLRELLSR